MMHEIAFVRDSRRRRRGKSTSYHHRLVELIVVVLKAPQLNSWNEEEELPWSVAMFLVLLLLIVHTLPIYLSTYLALTLTDWLVFMREREWEKLVVVSPMGLLASSWPPTDQEQQQQSIVCWIWDDRPTSTKVWPARGLFVSSVAVFWLRSLISSFVINRQKA